MIGVHYLFTRCARGLLAGGKILFSIWELFFSAFYFLVFNCSLSSRCPCGLTLRLCGLMLRLHGLIEKCWIAHMSPVLSSFILHSPILRGRSNEELGETSQSKSKAFLLDLNPHVLLPHPFLCQEIFLQLCCCSSSLCWPSLR